MNSTQNLIAQWVRPVIQNLSAYHVADAANLIKLDAMENPYPWPGTLQAAWLEHLHSLTINRYPDPAASLLKARVRERFALPEAAGLLLGNGSDELIQMLALLFGGEKRTLLALEPSFVMYRLIAHTTGLNYVGVSLQANDFALMLDNVLTAIATHHPALMFIAYPNNPTGNLFSRDHICQIINAAPGLVVIDEAYAPFTDASFLNEVLAYPNVLVMRTLSKMGLAGLRLGYIVGHSDWIEQLDKVRMPYNINVLTQISATFALEYSALLDAQTQRIREERERLFAALTMLSGVRVFPSQANFLLFQVPSGQAANVFQNLKKQGILIKNLDGTHPLLADCLRVTVGTPEENAAFIDALHSRNEFRVKSN